MQWRSGPVVSSRSQGYPFRNSTFPLPVWSRSVEPPLPMVPRRWRGFMRPTMLMSNSEVSDPLPVLAGGKRREEDDGGDDPLERLFGRAKAAVGISREPPAASAADIPVLTDNPDDAVPIGVAS